MDNRFSKRQIFERHHTEKFGSKQKTATVINHNTSQSASKTTTHNIFKGRYVSDPSTQSRTTIPLTVQFQQHKSFNRKVPSPNNVSVTKETPFIRNSTLIKNTTKMKNEKIDRNNNKQRNTRVIVKPLTLTPAHAHAHTHTDKDENNVFNNKYSTFIDILKKNRNFGRNDVEKSFAQLSLLTSRLKTSVESQSQSQSQSRTQSLVSTKEKEPDLPKKDISSIKSSMNATGLNIPAKSKPSFTKPFTNVSKTNNNTNNNTNKATNNVTYKTTYNVTNNVTNNNSNRLSRLLLDKKSTKHTPVTVYDYTSLYE